MKENKKTIKCNLYKDIKDILHPSISKKNISNYKIIIDDNLLPLRIYYPKKVSNLNNILIYFESAECITNNHQDKNHFLENFAIEYNQLIIVMEYYEYNNSYLLDEYSNFYKTLNFIYKELINNKIKKENIYVAGDLTGATVIFSILNKMLNNNIEVAGQILFYPIITKNIIENNNLSFNNSKDEFIYKNIEKYFKNKIKYKKDFKEVFPKLKDNNYFPKTLVIYNNNFLKEIKDLESLLENEITLIEVPLSYYDFFKNDYERKIYQEKIKDFLIK